MKKIRTLLSGQIPVIVIFAILGLSLIFVPAHTFNVISKVLFGVALILSGAYHIYIYVRPKKDYVASGLDLYPGVISLVLGIFLFKNPQLIRVLLPWVLGAFLVADCIWLVRSVFQMRKYKIAMWEVLVGVAVVFTVLGIILAYNPFSQVRTMLTFAGWLLLLKAITDLVLYLQVKKKIDNAVEEERLRQPAPAPTFSVANVEPQRPAAPSAFQEWRHKQKEKRAARAVAREEARAREEAERAERIRRDQEEAAREEEEAEAAFKAAAAQQAAAAASAKVNAANEPIDGTYSQADPADEPGDENIIDGVDYTEVEDGADVQADAEASAEAEEAADGAITE